MKARGFTLIEVIMTLVLLSFMVWIGIAAMLSGIDTWSFFTQRKDVLSDGRMALDRMLREIRMIKEPTSVAVANSTTFGFTDIDDNTITYYIDSGTINRTENGITNGLLSNVSSLSFVYYDASDAVVAAPLVAPSATDIRRVRIAITLSKGASGALNLQSDVSPRNLE
jgi:prepilin-type N-terminal cleavage/methylation domain-containing protein